MLKPDKFKRMSDSEPVKGSKDKIVTAKGNTITKSEFETAKKNGLEFESHEKYAEYVDGWAKPIKIKSDDELRKQYSQKGDNSFVVGTSGNKSGYQGSPENVKAIELKERKLKAMSTYNRGTR